MDRDITQAAFSRLTLQASIALVINDLGAHCVAEKDFVGLAAYLAGMGQDIQLHHLRCFGAVIEEGGLTGGGGTAVAYNAATPKPSDPRSSPLAVRSEIRWRVSASYSRGG